MDDSPRSRRGRRTVPASGPDRSQSNSKMTLKLQQGPLSGQAAGITGERARRCPGPGDRARRSTGGCARRRLPPRALPWAAQCAGPTRHSCKCLRARSQARPARPVAAGPCKGPGPVADRKGGAGRQSTAPVGSGPARARGAAAGWATRCRAPRPVLLVLEPQACQTVCAGQQTHRPERRGAAGLYGRGDGRREGRGRHVQQGGNQPAQPGRQVEGK
jgi:hypothetical protein